MHVLATFKILSATSLDLNEIQCIGQFNIGEFKSDISFFLQGNLQPVSATVKT